MSSLTFSAAHSLTHESTHVQLPQYLRLFQFHSKRENNVIRVTFQRTRRFQLHSCLQFDKKLLCVLQAVMTTGNVQVIEQMVAERTENGFLVRCSIATETKSVLFYGCSVSHTRLKSICTAGTAFSPGSGYVQKLQLKEESRVIQPLRNCRRFRPGHIVSSGLIFRC